MNRRRTQKRKDTVNDGQERRRGRRRSLFLIDGHRIISGWPGRILGLATKRRERERKRKERRLRPLQRQNSVEFWDTVQIHSAGSARWVPHKSHTSPRASSARIRGLSHATQRALSRLSRDVLSSFLSLLLYLLTLLALSTVVQS